MRFVLIISGVLLFLNSCTTGYALKSVDYNELLTDGNSKVWLIDKMIIKGVNISQHNTQSKEVLIFHRNGVVDYLPLKAIGDKTPFKADYFLDSEKRLLTLYFSEETWEFDITTLKESRIVLTSTKKSDSQLTLELVPLPEL